MKGAVQQRSAGSWELKYDLPRVDGRRRQRTVTVRGTRKQAEAELARLVHEANQGLGPGLGRMTVAALLEKWLTDHCEPNWEATPLRAARSGVRIHIIPALGHHQIAALTALQVQDYFASKRGRLSAQTLLHHHKFLKQAFSHAVRWDLLARNVIGRVTAPRVRTEEPKAFTEEQCALLLREAQEPLRLGILIAIATGMRRGEIVGLRWEDVDLKAGVLVVRQSMTDRGVAKPPKTAKGRRVITLPSVAVDELARQKGIQAELARDVGEMPAHVISWPDGRQMRCDYLTRGFQDLAKRLGLPSTRFHDLRHSHASHLLARGLDVVSVSHRLGHANASITLRVYSHSIPGTQDRAASMIDGVLRPGVEE